MNSSYEGAIAFQHYHLIINKMGVFTAAILEHMMNKVAVIQFSILVD